MSASGLVEADVWVQTPGNSFQPSDFWQKVRAQAQRVVIMLCTGAVYRAVQACCHGGTAMSSCPSRHHWRAPPVAMPWTTMTPGRWPGQLLLHGHTLCRLLLPDQLLPGAGAAAHARSNRSCWRAPAPVVLVSRHGLREHCQEAGILKFDMRHEIHAILHWNEQPCWYFSLMSTSSTSCSADDREWHRDWQVC